MRCRPAAVFRPVLPAPDWSLLGSQCHRPGVSQVPSPPLTIRPRRYAACRPGPPARRHPLSRGPAECSAYRDRHRQRPSPPIGATPDQRGRPLIRSPQMLRSPVDHHHQRVSPETQSTPPPSPTRREPQQQNAARSPQSPGPRAGSVQPASQHQAGQSRRAHPHRCRRARPAIGRKRWRTPP